MLPAAQSMENFPFHAKGSDQVSQAPQVRRAGLTPRIVLIAVVRAIFKPARQRLDRNIA